MTFIAPCFSIFSYGGGRTPSCLVCTCSMYTLSQYNWKFLVCCISRGGRSCDSEWDTEASIGPLEQGSCSRWVSTRSNSVTSYKHFTHLNLNLAHYMSHSLQRKSIPYVAISGRNQTLLVCVFQSHCCIRSIVRSTELLLRAGLIHYTV